MLLSLKYYIICFNRRSFMTSIARKNNVSVNTVQRVLGNCSHRFIDSYEYLPAHLAFDKFKGADRQLHLSAWMTTIIKSFRFLEPAIKRLCLNILVVFHFKPEPTSKRSRWISTFTIRTLSELVFLMHKLSSIAFTWSKCLRALSTR